MRISELTGLSLPDLALEDQLVRVLGKGNKERLVPLGRYAATPWTPGWDRGGARLWSRSDGAGGLTRLPFSST